MPQAPCLLLLVLLNFYTVVAAGLALQNITIVAPVGTSQHGDIHLLCVPMQAFDILVFFGANYVAHAATVRAYPGESVFNFGWGVVAAVLLPTSGMFRGSSSILRARFGSSRHPSPLELATRCGALCMVVRTKHWRPIPGDRLTQVAVTKRGPRRAYQELDDKPRPWAMYPDMFPAFYIDPRFRAQYFAAQFLDLLQVIVPSFIGPAEICHVLCRALCRALCRVLHRVFTGSSIVPSEEGVEMDPSQDYAERRVQEVQLYPEGGRHCSDNRPIASLNSAQTEEERVSQRVLSRIWQTLRRPIIADSSQADEDQQGQEPQRSFLARMRLLWAGLPMERRRRSIARKASRKWLRSKATRKIPGDPMAHTPLSEVLNSHHTETSSISTRTCTIAMPRTYIPRWLKNDVGGLVLPDTITVTTGDRKINGHQTLPEGYDFAFVPSNAKVVPLADGDRPTVPPPQISVAKSLVALGQAGYAFFTLYTARGDQITRYGYSAPGLSVLPYAFMSMINLVAAILSPDYPELYLVQSDTLLEASARPGANFEGVVGKLLPVTTGRTDTDIPQFSENVFEGVVRTRGEDSRLQIELGGFAFTLATGPDQNSPAIEIPACGEFQQNAPEISTSTGARGIWSEALEIDLGSLKDKFVSALEMWSMSPISHFAVANTVLCLIFLILIRVGTGTGEEVAPFAGTDSTLFQRIVMPPWLLAAPFYGLWAAWSQFQFSSDGKGLTTKIMTLAVGGVPAVLGFAAVAQILLKYGNCTKYD